MREMLYILHDPTPGLLNILSILKACPVTVWPEHWKEFQAYNASLTF